MDRIVICIVVVTDQWVQYIDHFRIGNGHVVMIGLNDMTSVLEMNREHILLYSDVRLSFIGYQYPNFDY
jgi:hypothetical protein